VRKSSFEHLKKKKSSEEQRGRGVRDQLKGNLNDFMLPLKSAFV
jgi:hypothetical protein